MFCFVALNSSISSRFSLFQAAVTGNKPTGYIVAPVYNRLWCIPLSVSVYPSSGCVLVETSIETSEAIGVFDSSFLGLVSSVEVKYSAGVFVSIVLLSLDTRPLKLSSVRVSTPA